MVHRGRGGMLGRQAPGRRARCRQRAGGRAGRARGVCSRRASRISSGVFIPRRRINTGGAVAVAERWRVPCSPRVCEMLSNRADAASMSRLA
ncbi:hypothetical protein MSG28_010890 [Choristoneura fumiferana]|uniref:Uncharacterized protein n=1 Tax=Choristoneura fumiferana TaxID=7141 RepID=A0ACC0KPW5_CHOFU|nr:hypothetical protein MSG28_010890 [Choristoneura fumiferana]